jgi:hypothetical protein
MDHHQSLCDQSVSQALQLRNIKEKLTQKCDLQNLENTLLNSIGDISGDSDSFTETSRNSASGAVFTTTLRPQSPSTKAHIRNNIILPSWSDQEPAGLPKTKHSVDDRQVEQKIQAFKMVRSPPLATLQDARKDRISLAPEHTKKKAGEEEVHVGWGCFKGVATDFPAAASRQHSGFLSSAIAMRMRMSEELQSKEKTDKKTAAGQQRHSVSFDSVRQPWVRR